MGVLRASCAAHNPPALQFVEMMRLYPYLNQRGNQKQVPAICSLKYSKHCFIETARRYSRCK
jgi:hypothetical protein